MAIWSHNKRKHIRACLLEQDRINGVGHRFIPYALDGWRRKQCKKCKKMFYTAPMTYFVYKSRKRNGSTDFCCECDKFKKDWKRMGTKEDEEVYLARCEAHGIKISYVKKD